MPGTRKEILNGETNNCYGDASRQVAINALEEHGEFAKLLKKDVPKDDVCVSMVCICTP